jgi:hypothetical protein
MPVILPEAVPLHEVTSVEPDTPAHDVVAAVDDSSSDLLQAPITAIIPTINANQNTIFFMIFSSFLSYYSIIHSLYN